MESGVFQDLRVNSIETKIFKIKRKYTKIKRLCARMKKSSLVFISLRGAENLNVPFNRDSAPE